MRLRPGDTRSRCSRFLKQFHPQQRLRFWRVQRLPLPCVGMWLFARLEYRDDV